MRLRTLTGLEVDKLNAEYDELMKNIAYFKEILSDEKLRYKIIREELVEIGENMAMSVVRILFTLAMI